MKNKNGFVLSTYVYMLLVFFLLLLVTMLAVLNNTKMLSNKLKEQSSNTSGLIDKQYSFILKGNNNVIVGTGEEYNEPGFIAKTSEGKELTNSVKIVGNVDVNTIGKYTLTYKITYNGISRELKRNIYVVDNVASNYVEEVYKINRTDNGLIRDNTVDQNIRYAGSNPNNYVYFNCKEEYTNDSKTIEYGDEDYVYEDNCEVWRIIGVFDTKSTDSETEEAVPRIKIVRDKVLSTTMKWDTTADGVNYVNQWGETTLPDGTTPYEGSSLMQYLNIGDSSYYSSLSSIAKGQISDALWYTAAVTNDTANGVYEDERSDETGTSTVINYTTTWVGKIGLIYPSDFAYAGTNCGSYTIYDYNQSDSCGKTRNWLKTSSRYWTITRAASSSAGAWCVYVEGNVYYGAHINYNNAIRPTLYLSSNVKIIGGNGTETNPYKLSS